MTDGVNKERVQLLVDALRSGEFKQGYGSLREIDGADDRYCCLGVACLVAQRNGLDVEERHKGNDGYYFGTAYEFDNGGDEDLTLPCSVRKWYGFGISNPALLTSSDEFESATMVNDDLQFDFNQIADAFERTFLQDEETTNGEQEHQAQS